MNNKRMVGYNEKHVNETVYLSMEKCRKINDALRIESERENKNVKPEKNIKGGN